MGVKQVIILRKDIEMSKGKLVAQGAHASLEAALKSKEEKPGIFERWRRGGQKKVILKASLEKIKAIRERAEDEIVTSLVEDRGLTELEPGTKTALALGPDREDKIDKLTSSLPLL